MTGTLLWRQQGCADLSIVSLSFLVPPNMEDESYNKVAVSATVVRVELGVVRGEYQELVEDRAGTSVN